MPKPREYKGSNSKSWWPGEASVMSDNLNNVLVRRRDDIRDWLDDQAPFTVCDQKHLDADTPERAYWHHGYQAALSDIIDMLDRAGIDAGARPARK